MPRLMTQKRQPAITSVALHLRWLTLDGCTASCCHASQRGIRHSFGMGFCMADVPLHVEPTHAEDPAHPPLADLAAVCLLCQLLVQMGGEESLLVVAAVTVIAVEMLSEPKRPSPWH
mmetsp:Transcript_13199/g.21941  ORF Transcript_13199/g.21941 Transcript_13199/m.21941 type:complete len:117 (+) Transcript_13199:477-827(+)